MTNQLWHSPSGGYTFNIMNPYEGYQPLPLSTADAADQHETSKMESEEALLKKAKGLHDVDLWYTQNGIPGNLEHMDDILVLVKFPHSASNFSCGRSRFNTFTMPIDYDSLLSTGSELLLAMLKDVQQYQRQAGKAAVALPAGVTHILDLSPTSDENDYISALQNLSITQNIKLWHRSMVCGTSPLTVAGHDDVCSCSFGHTYPALKGPWKSPKPDGNACIFDTDSWPVQPWTSIDDFCTTRWAANTVRLFRAIAKPAGLKDLLIDSAPRLWTLVGLFNKLEMTNYDILVSILGPPLRLTIPLEQTLTCTPA